MDDIIGKGLNKLYKFNDFPLQLFQFLTSF